MQTYLLAVAGFAIVVTLYQLFNSIRQYLRLRHIPGPPLAAWTDLWWISKSISKKSQIVLGDACAKYGSIARIGPNLLVTCDLDLYRKTNALRSSTYRKTIWYSAFRLDAERENVFSERDEEKHQKKRQRVATGYSGKDNRELEPSIDKIILQAIALIRDKYLSVGAQPKNLDLARLSYFIGLDVITLLGLGEAFGFVADNEDKFSYMKAWQENFPMINFCADVPVLLSIMTIPVIQKLLLPSEKDKIGLGRAKAVARAAIDRRFSEEKPDHHDMVLSFKKSGMSATEVADEALLQLLAGSDTTSTIMRTGFASIIANPRIYQRLISEIRTVNVPLSEVAPNVTLIKLPYLQACVKEALRHHPAASGLLPREVVNPRGDTHNGVYLPPGTVIGVSSWAMHRNNTDVYGADAAIYRPERWIEAPKDRLTVMEDSLYTVFGYGRNRCLGENIAKIELNKVFFEMFRRFDWSFADIVGKGVFERAENYGLFLHQGMWVIARPLEDL